ncbi:MAG: hypothetical protein LBS81_00450 [Endomicrobium sp.]|jgi:DNA-binding MarR family transcriptional regulator|nr:hypothetical protein [Endomicrobium sp.]
MSKEEQVIMGSRDLLNKMVWLNKFKMEESLKGYKSSEVHCIEYIGRNVDFNVTKLAGFFYMTNGAISKIAKELIKKALLKATGSRITRKKSILSLLQGKVINKVHEELRKEFQARDKAAFSR